MQLGCAYILDTCIEAARTSTMKYCCNVYNTDGSIKYTDYTRCPGGCSGGGTMSTTCTCPTLNWLTDETGTYNGTSCTGEGDTVSKPCVKLSASSTDEKGNACATYAAQ